MEIKQFETIELDIKDIKRPLKNPNKMSDFMFMSLVEGIKKDGFIYPLILRKEDSRIIDGDHRYLAAIEAGLSKVKCILLDVTEEESIKIGIGLNQKKGYFDYVELRDILTEMEDKDLPALSLDTGFTEIELQRLLEQSTFDNDKLIKQKLAEIGIPTDKIDAMADVYKTGNFQELPKSDLKGNQEGIRYPLIFFVDSEESYNFLKDFFKKEGSKEPDTNKLMEMVKNA